MRYHGDNETIFINAGHITWRYWLRKVREIDLKRFEKFKGKPSSFEEKQGIQDEGSKRSANGDHSPSEKGGIGSSRELPCRVAISLQGLEWIVYNRSPAYDAVVEGMMRKDRARPSGSNSNEDRDPKPYEEKNQPTTPTPSAATLVLEKLTSAFPPPVIEPIVSRKQGPDHKMYKGKGLVEPERPSTSNSSGSEAVQDSATRDQSPMTSIMLRVFPLQIDCNKAAIVMGNENTKGILIIKCSKAKGNVDASKAQPVDKYKQLLNFQFSNPMILLRNNPDYKGSQMTTAGHRKEGRNQSRPKHTPKGLLWYIRWNKHRAWRGLLYLIPSLRDSVESFSGRAFDKDNLPNDGDDRARSSSSNHWMGLSRYLDEAQQIEQDRWGSIEYGEFTNIVEGPQARMSFYWDEPGSVDRPRSRSAQEDLKGTDILNGAPPPAWGLDIALESGIIHYGPWADRMRADIQSVFFPRLYRDSTPAEPLLPGQIRSYTTFKVFIELEDTTTLRIPLREESKDWKWKGRAQATNDARDARNTLRRRHGPRSDGAKRKKKGVPGPEVRPFGWVEVRVTSNTTISYSMDLVGDERGFKNRLDLDLRGVEVSSSVNHGLLLRSAIQSISCDLSTPLKWNSLHRWRIDVSSDGLELFLLRDHIYLLTDLITDWGAGPPSDYFTFTPFEYLISFHLSNFNINLNVNDSNIINDPADMDDNTFITIRGTGLTADIVVPFNTYRPLENEVSFNILAHTGGLDLKTPPWNTQTAFLDSNHVALLKELTVVGRYNYFTKTSTSLTDTLILDIHGSKLALDLHGFVIRYLLKIKDNYFVDDIHFKTFEEYQAQVKKLKDPSNTSAMEDIHYYKTNDLDVILNAGASNVSVMLPAKLYTSNDHVRLDFSELSAELRFTSYYMDLEVDFSPMSVSAGTGGDGVSSEESILSGTQAFVDGLTIHGHRIFGLPPTEPTYVCDWDFRVGSITGESSMVFLKKLLYAVRNIAFCFHDEENALEPLPVGVLHDVVYLRVRVMPIRVWIRMDDTAFLFETDDINLNLNDLADDRFSERFNLSIPRLVVACVDGEAAARHKYRNTTNVETYGYFETSISVGMLQRSLQFNSNRAKQQNHIKYQDQRTLRAGFLVHNHEVEREMEPSRFVRMDPPAMPFPPMPQPIHSHQAEESSRGSIKNAASTSRFLSVSQSLSDMSSDESVVRKPPARNLSSRSVPSSLSVSQRFQTPIEGRSARSRISLHSDQRRQSSTRGVSETRQRFAASQPVPRLSSTFACPRFAFQDVTPNISRVPSAPAAYSADPKIEDFRSFTHSRSLNQSEDSVHSSMSIEFPNGIRLYCNAKIISSISKALDQLQPTDPAEVLDGLQIDVFSTLLKLTKQEKMSNVTTDLGLRVPFIRARIVNSIVAPTFDHRSSDEDEYYLGLTRLSTTSRNRVFEKQENLKQEESSLYVRFDELDVSAKEYLEMETVDNAAIRIQVKDLVCWMVNEQSASANLRCRSFELYTRSHKLAFLADLVHHTTSLIDQNSKEFANLAKKQQDQLENLIEALIFSGKSLTDPTFLTRPSYVLRSDAKHLRTHDSWKIMSRWRQKYLSLPEDARKEADRTCLEKTPRTSKVDKAAVLKRLKEWRTQDIVDLKGCLIFSRGFGKDFLTSTPREGPEKKSMQASLELSQLACLIDPGPEQNQITMNTITASVVNSVASQSSATPQLDVTHFPSDTTVVQVHGRKFGARVNWEICELIENVMTLYQGNGAAVPLDSSNTITNASPKQIDSLNSKARNLQIVIGLDIGTIALDTINLRAIMASKSLQVSVATADDPSSEQKTPITALIHAQMGSSEIVSHSQVLTVSRVHHPTIYFSLEKFIDNRVTRNVYKMASSYQSIVFEFRQEILVMIEVFDLVLGDELAQLHRLLGRLRQDPGSNQLTKASNIASSEEINEVHGAIFLDSYHISMHLLQSLVYEISGTTARISIAPVSKNTCRLDFDVKEHSHDCRTTIKDQIQSISVLKLPPINGRILSRMTQSESFIQMAISIESITLDAAAVSSLFSALNRPQISQAVKNIRTDVSSSMDHWTQVFGSQDKPDRVIEEKQTAPLIYDANITLAGIGIHAQAPGMLPGEHAAELDFNFGSVRIKAMNRTGKDGPSLRYPEIRIGLRGISFELARIQGTDHQPCGNLQFEAYATCASKRNEAGVLVRSYHIKSGALEVNLFAETASTVVDVVGNLQDRIKDIDLSKEVKYLQNIGRPRSKIVVTDVNSSRSKEESPSKKLFTSMYSLEMLNIQVSWIVGGDYFALSPKREAEDLVLSFKRIDLATRKGNAARLLVEDFQLQMVPVSQSKTKRSLNSALLPEVIFNVAYLSTKDDRRLAFQAVGKSLDLRCTSESILPASDLERSIAKASARFRAAAATWSALPTDTGGERKSLMGNKRLASLLVDADFAGAVVYIEGRRQFDLESSSFSLLRSGRVPQQGRYGQFTQEDATSSTTLKAPGIAFKVEYKDNGQENPSLNAEIKVDASSNILYPTVVPLIMEMTSSIKEIVRDNEPEPKSATSKPASQRFLDEDNIFTTDPTAILGRCKLNVGLRICRQEFSLSCQPVARVAATARFEDIYITINTVKSADHGNFFAISATITRLQASVQHVYSRESTGNFEVESVVLSFMNSKHVSGDSGVSAILKVSPIKAQINAKQLQDFLLFREIWIPEEIRQDQAAPEPIPSSEPQAYLVQRYQQVAAAGAFPWNATVAVSELDVQLDLGQSLGKSSFKITNFWVSSKKSSDWEQVLGLGFEKVGVSSVGRMSGFVELQDFKLRTSIQWPERQDALDETPLIQASLGFQRLRLKASFDYQVFLIADISSFEFLMYNVRDRSKEQGDRLVGILDGDRVQIFCTTTSASQGLALYQALQRLVQEKKAAYETSLRDIEKFLKRKSGTPAFSHPPKVLKSATEQEDLEKTPISLHTDVVVTLKAVNVGSFPSTFFDNQIFKIEALESQARFAVTMQRGRVHSGLGLTVGELRVALAAVKRPNVPKTLAEIDVDEVVSQATSARGGTILRVPKVIASMQTWQELNSNHIDYIFKSSLEGKVDVGWNYSRISYIRGMWMSHSRALAQRLGKPLPPSAVQITGGPKPDLSGRDIEDETVDRGGQEKITAVVNVPQSKYEYTALEPAIIETPQLRDMGEATPPLEWIGVHRDRLPNLTHQIIIVSLLEIAREVEDAYSKILGSS